MIYVYTFELPSTFWTLSNYSRGERKVLPKPRRTLRLESFDDERMLQVGTL